MTLSAGDAVASSRAGRLFLSFDGATAVASALSGEASFTAGGKTVTLNAGELSSAKGAAPTRPIKIPNKVFVDVKWPEFQSTNQNELMIKGRASAYARVLIGGRKPEAMPDGSFQLKVPLQRGAQTINVVAVDPLGRRAVTTRRIVMDPDAPRITGQAEFQ